MRQRVSIDAEPSNFALFPILIRSGVAFMRTGAAPLIAAALLLTFGRQGVAQSLDELQKNCLDAKFDSPWSSPAQSAARRLPEICARQDR